MGKRLNERFLAAYITLDKDCAEKFGVATGGLTEYINRLNNARFAPGREDALPRLVRYRNIRNKMAHELGSLRKMNDVTSADIAWIRKFDRDLLRRKDPISAYLKRARRYARRRKIQRYLTIAAAGALLVAGVILYFALSK
ncbi:MAG: hypothetical protein J6V09_00310 [Clostridia bacterium]|nr:hypothetical protein [Clostridia bacterium]